MKHPTSSLIDDFLWHVDHGLILGHDGDLNPELKPAGADSSGPATLAQMAAALRRILDGEKADEALKITRTDGEQRDPIWDYISRVVHNNRKQNVKWAVIEKMVNDYLSTINRPPVSERAIRKAYDLRKADLEAKDSQYAMLRFIREKK